MPAGVTGPGKIWLSDTRVCVYVHVKVVEVGSRTMGYGDIATGGEGGEGGEEGA